MNIRQWAASACGIAAVFSLSGTAQSFRQTQTDDYTRYELQEPGSQSFRIYYDVSATAAGARYYFNSIRRGSEPTVHGVYDLMTGKALEWAIVDGAQAREDGMLNASAQGQYIRATLLRPVPAGGQARVRIDKTYEDPRSYTREGNAITFSRSLGIKRNAVVLPAGYELVGCNYPSQVIQEDDGRIAVSFMNRGPASVPFEVKAVKLPARGAADSAVARPERRPAAASAGGGGAGGNRARVNYRFDERAFQDRDIVYFLQQPETHSFRLYHDYTEKREGVDKYLNVVRAGSKATNPSAMVLDTGEQLRVETLRGTEIAENDISVGSAGPDTEVVVIWFDPVPSGGSVRLRIEETYTDPNRYLLAGDELVWDRRFGRPRNTVILPDGWYLTANSIPAVVTRTENGRISLRYTNDRPGNIEVFVKGKRR